MKKIIIPLLIIFSGTCVLHAQIGKPKVKPKVSIPVGLPTTFDEIVNDLSNGRCHELVVASVQLNARNRQHTAFHREVRYGSGTVVKRGKYLEIVFPLQIGIKQASTQRTLTTTIKIKKQGKKVSLDIRNSQYYHLFYNVEIIKKNNGYFITVEKDFDSETVSFTFAIHRAACLI
ncbi:hypothetical protein [Flagellimonas sp.]|uniref:hypothetical protein n=1 Tax=Flagellimonas sp. TaxID=2058762 RepID=UPI003F4A61B8